MFENPGYIAKAVHEDDPDAKSAMANPAYQEFFKENSNKISKIGAKSFGDEDGSSYYSQYLVPMVYYNVVSGYSDGTFRGSNEVTRQEFAVMLSKCLHGTDAQDTEGRYYKKLVGTGMADWALPYWNKVNLRMITLTDLKGNQAEVAASGCTRYEVANAIASAFFGDETSAYTEKARVSAHPFNDIGKRITLEESVSLWESDTEWLYKSYTDSSYGVCEDTIGNVMLLKDKGILNGFEDGSLRGTEAVRRQDVIILLSKAIEVYGAQY